jgi:hypothetical protein
MEKRRSNRTEKRILHSNAPSKANEMDLERVTLDQLQGGRELCAWFEGIPSFHDATLTELEVRQGAPSRIVAHAFKTGAELDAKGFFILTKHVVVTLTMFDLVSVELFDFMEAGIMDGLDIERDEQGITLNFDASYGVHGRIKAKCVTISFEPKPAEFRG